LNDPQKTVSVKKSALPEDPQLDEDLRLGLRFWDP
jgi:hypothetical protein